MHPRISRRNLLHTIGRSILSGAGGLTGVSGIVLVDPMQVRDPADRIGEGSLRHHEPIFCDHGAFLG